MKLFHNERKTIICYGETVTFSIISQCSIFLVKAFVINKTLEIVHDKVFQELHYSKYLSDSLSALVTL